MGPDRAPVCSGLRRSHDLACLREQKRPEPGRYQSQAVSLSIKERLGMKRERGSATSAQLPVDGDRDKLARDLSREKSAVASVTPQRNSEPGCTDRAEMDLLDENCRILKIGVAVHARDR